MLYQWKKKKKKKKEKNRKSKLYNRKEKMKKPPPWSIYLQGIPTCVISTTNWRNLWLKYNCARKNKSSGKRKYKRAISEEHLQYTTLEKKRKLPEIFLRAKILKLIGLEKIRSLRCFWILELNSSLAVPLPWFYNTFGQESSCAC